MSVAEKLPLSENRAVASRVPSRRAEIRIVMTGPAVGTWALEHERDDLRRVGFIVSSRPELTVQTGHRALGAAYLEGYVELVLAVDRGEFANSFEALQLAAERLTQLPDAEHLARASLRVEIVEEWR